MKATYITFELFLLFTFCQLCIIAAWRYSTNAALNGYKCNVDDVAFEKDKISELACASFCDGSTTCLSVFYQQASLKCVGCKVWYNANEVSRTMSGSLYYEKQICPDDTVIKRGRSCYFVSSEEDLTFHESTSFCQERGAQAETSDENAFLKTYFKNTTAGNTWQGLTDLGAEGTWEWYSTDDPIEFEDWRGSEPDGNTGENCAAFAKFEDRQWVDVACSHYNGYFTMCEKELVDE